MPRLRKITAMSSPDNSQSATAMIMTVFSKAVEWCKQIEVNRLDIVKFIHRADNISGYRTGYAAFLQ